MGVKLGGSKEIRTGGKDRVKLEDLFDLAEFPNQEFKTFRPVGEIVANGTHWFEYYYVEKDTNQLKKGRTGRTCRNVQFDGDIDPKGKCGFCKMGHQPRVNFFQNMIDTEEEENPPRNIKGPTPEEKKLGKKLKGTKLWTPVVVLPFPPTVAQTMQKLTKKNKDKEGKVRELYDPSFGRALDISKDTRDGTSPGNIWNVQRAEEPMKKLSAEQREYYLWDLEGGLKKLIPDVKTSKADAKWAATRMADKDFEGLDLSEFPELLAERDKFFGKKGKKSKSGSFRVDDEDDDEDDKPRKRRPIDDDDDDDDTPRRSKKRASRDDDDDDDLPKRNKKSTGKKKKRKSFNVDDVM
jgi:hypothetical protein